MPEASCVHVNIRIWRDFPPIFGVLRHVVARSTAMVSTTGRGVTDGVHPMTLDAEYMLSPSLYVQYGVLLGKTLFAMR